MIHVSVCVGSACHLKGSYTVIAQLQALISAHELTDKVSLTGSFCLGTCGKGVSVNIDGNLLHTTPDETEALFMQHIKLPAKQGSICKESGCTNSD